ncbi:MAG: RNA recognition motif domain-containing protein [Spirochaetota bacterium]
MTNKLYVGNLDYNLTEDDIREIFDSYGTVENVKLIIDRDSNRSKGFAFVTMSTEEEAEHAIDELSDKELEGRPLKVSEARERKNNRRFNNNRNQNFKRDRW